MEINLGSRSAQAALATILLIGGIIVLFAIALAAIALSFLNSTLGFQAATKAEAVAMGGIRDAEIELLRNASFSDTSGYCVPYNATTPCPVGSALVTVTQNSPATGQVTVVSNANFVRRRVIQAIYTLNASTTELRQTSLKVIAQ